MIFILFHDVVSYAAGLTKLKFIPFIVITIVVFIIPTALFVAIGLALVERSLFNYIFILIIIIGILFFIYEKFYRSKKSRK